MLNFRWKFCLLPLCVLFLTNSVSADDVDDDEDEGLPIEHLEIMSLFDKPSRPGEKVVLKGSSSLGVGGGMHKRAGSKKVIYNAKIRPKTSGKPNTAPVIEIDKKLLKELIKFGRDQPFTPIIKKHGKLANELITILLDAPTVADVKAIGDKYQSSINPGMFMYALSVALMHRNDTRNYPISQLAEVYPKKFVDGRIMRKATEAVNDAGSNQPIEIAKNYTTASNREIEHRLAYFREDFGINLHHWHWHLVHPFDGDDRIIYKDRRGELFYYMHHQILARYNAERLGNQLPRVKRLNNLREPILEGYFSKMDNHVSSLSWPPRPSGLILQDLDRPDSKFDIQDLERWTNRLYEAIYAGYMIGKNGEQIPLTEEGGIDLLGNAVEASPKMSPNFDYYGSVHNKGHMALAFVHDPEYCHMESYGVLGDSATAMRDPVFYRWHSFIDEIFVEYKNTLKPYTDAQLEYPGIEVTNVKIVSGKVSNRLNTFWTWCDIDLSRGLDFAPKAPIRARFNHLDHKPFKYEIKVKNTLNSNKDGVVRIFIAPKFDERGERFNLKEQSNFMIEMDRFDVTLEPGDNVIKRFSNESSLTISLSTNARHLNLDVIPIDETFCGCGWPQHMLVPRGTKSGMAMDLFVMVSNDDVDFVKLDKLTGSKAAPIFCGFRDRKYPEARAMGYPFDRKPGMFVETLGQFLKPNMATADITVQFSDETV